MELKITRTDRNMLILLSGELDHHGAKEIMRKIEQCIDANLPLQLVLDFSGVTFMDSSGVAVVIRAYRRMQLLQGSLLVTEVPAQAKKVLQAANIGRLVKMI